MVLKVRLSLLVAILLCCLSGTSQTQFKKIDEAMLSVPSQNENSIESLVKYIESKAQNNLEKARAAFCWIANNVAYDIRKFERDKPSNFEPEKVFKKRIAVCAGFANLYQDLCKRMNIPCEMVSGYGKGYGFKKGQVLNESDHVWNAIKADSVWRLVDVTWASGSIKKVLFLSTFKRAYEPKYFATKPEEFLLTHLPEVPMWQLIEHPVSLRSFTMDDSKIFEEIKKQKSPYFNYNDTIAKFLATETIQMGIDFGKMALRYNSHNPIPLAIGMLRNVDNNIHQERYSVASGIGLIDSMIYFTENAMKLFRKAKSSSKSMHEALEENLKIGNRTLAELHFLRAGYYETKLTSQTSLSYDSLIFVSNEVTNSLLTVIKLSRETHKRKLLKKAQENYCQVTLNVYRALSDFELKETDPVKQKRIHKQEVALINKARKNITEPGDCHDNIMNMKL